VDVYKAVVVPILNNSSHKRVLNQDRVSKSCTG
jgi:hypothetical protein